MSKIFFKLMALFAVLLAMPTTAAMAQATRTWVSGVGDDVNPCSRTAPCKTFAGAISKTAANGEINVLDSAGYGAVTITKSITIKADGSTAGVLVSAGSGVTINSATAKVVLDGLDFEGLSNGVSINGVNVLAARNVKVINCAIRGFTAAGSAGVRVNNSGTAVVTVENSYLFNNTIGVLVNPASGLGRAKIINSTIEASSLAGIQVLGTGNNAVITGNEIFDTPASIDFGPGATIDSFGDNVLGGTSTDTPNQIAKN